MSDTIWVALITAIATTVPTSINNYLNIREQRKLKKFELIEVSKQKVINEYLECAGACFNNKDKTLLSKYQIATNKLLLYFPDLSLGLLSNIEACFDSDYIQYLKRITQLTKELSKLQSEK